MEKGVRGASLPSVMALAYLGDSEYEVFVRRRLVDEGLSHAGELNRRSLSYVTAERQAAVMRGLLPQLHEDEADIFRRARNHPHLNRPKHASVMDYRYATGFEAVLGMLSYLGRRERLNELLALALTLADGENEQPNNEENRKDDIL